MPYILKILMLRTSCFKLPTSIINFSFAGLEKEIVQVVTKGLGVMATPLSFGEGLGVRFNIGGEVN